MKMKKAKKLFIALLTLVIAFTVVVLPMEYTVRVSASEAEVVNPLAKYEFLDAANPGKDSMGNYDLTLKTTDGGTVSVADGVATFNGTGALIAGSEAEDIGEDLKSFTMSFSVATDGVQVGSWAEAIGFGWNAWSCSRWNLFYFANGSKDIRFSAASQLVETTTDSGETKNVSDVTGNGNQWWDSVVTTVKTADSNEFTDILLVVDLEGKISLYADGVLIRSYDTPEGYSTSNSNMRFAIGANATWGSLRNYFTGKIANVEIYDFAFDTLQVISYNVNGRLTTSDIAEQEEVNPLAKYDFLDAANPGKDSMGNYDLTLKTTDGGTVSVADGVATFNGTGALIAGSEAEDIGEDVKSFTMAFSVATNGEQVGSWAEAIGFGWNAWSCSRWNLFYFANGSKDIRFSAASQLVETTTDSGETKNVSDVTGNGNQWWDSVVTTVKTADSNEFTDILLVVDLEGKISLYADGVLIRSYDTPEGYSTSNSNMRFAIGANATWGSLRNYFTGKIANVEIYDIALSDVQIAQYNETGKVYRALDVIVSETVVDLSSSIVVPAGLTSAQILALAPSSSKIDVNMSNDSTKTVDVNWSAVEVIDGNTYLVGEITGLVNPNGVKAYAKINVLENTKVLLPIALYEFNDANNPGKDSMGNWDLKVVTEKDAEGNYLDGNVRVENGVAYFDGTAALLSGSEDNDISEALKSFTLTFEVLQTQTSGSWSEPIGFGWDDWTPKAKWCTFELSSGSNDLRFTTASSRDEESGKSNVDGNNNQWWGPIVGNISSRQTVVLSVDLEGNIVVYVNGVKKYSYATPEGYSLSNETMQFAIGGSGAWSAVHSLFVGQMSNVAIYDFAVNDSQAIELCATHKLSTGITTTAPYVTDINTTPVFADETKLTTAMSVEEMITILNNSAKVTATLSDASTMDLPVAWTSIVNEAGVYTAHGYVVCEGVLTVVVVNGVEVSYTLTVTDVATSIKVSSNPSKVEYKYGEELDLAGLVVKNVMGSGAEVELTSADYTVSGYDKNVLGKQTITVTAGEYTATFEVTVVDYITSINLKAAPTKLTYKVGEELDVTGAVVEVVMASGAEVELSSADYTVSGYDKNVLGEQTVTIKAGEHTATFEVTVEDYIASINLKPIPTKLTYKIGEELDLAGLVVKNVMGSGAEVELTSADYTVSGYDKNVLGKQTITVKAGEHTATFEVTVEDYITSINLKSAPTKLTYTVGEELDVTGAVVEVVMASGAKNDVTLTNEMVSGFDSSKAGVNTVTITYEGNTITVDLTIEEKPATGCGGSVIASLFGLVALAGSVVLLRKKREE